ncbi:MAG: Leu/Phe/Val dehydrogenase [bacterium]
MQIFERLRIDSHEQLIFFREQFSGLRAIIAIHDATLGPAIGGVRMLKYVSEDQAVEDVLRLSHAMTLKAAGAGVNFGGGQAVIIGDPRKDRSEALFRGLGRFIEGLGGRFIAAEDVGTTYEDMDYIRMETRYVVGIPSSRGGSGDPSPMCAYGVIRGIEACQEFRTGSESLKGVKVAVQGVGKVGSVVVKMLIDRGARVFIADVDTQAVERTRSQYDIEVVSPDEIYSLDCDIFCPCALGGVINDRTIELLRCKIVAGAANNQLDRSRHGDLLDQKGIIYAPDYIINAGGLINVVDELSGYDQARAMRKTSAIRDVLLNILERSRSQKVPTWRAAEQLVMERIEKVARVRRSYLP